MALLESCYCCNLLIASVLIAVYVLVAYVIAFVIELWWILETEVALPAPAYLLCLGYFIVFIQTGFLLHGLSVKRSLYLMGWLFVIVIFSFPEAGLVLFMSLYHWQLDHLYGLTELTCWVIRVCINIAGLLIIQSLHSQWKEEVEVMQRLQALNMTSIIPQRVGGHASNGHLVNGSAIGGHHNDAFVKSTERLNGSLRRPHSVLSRVSPNHLFNGPLNGPLNGPFNGPLNNNLVYPVPLNNAPPLLYAPPELANHSSSEFNASQFDAIASTYTNQIYNNLDTESPNNIAKFNRTQSLLDLRTIKKISDVNTDTRSLNGDRTDFVRPNYTQSLDRRKYRRRGGSINELNDYNSLERMNVYTDSEGRYVLQTGPGPRDCYRYRSFDGQRRMRGAESGRSLAESDDLRRYQDVAL